MPSWFETLNVSWGAVGWGAAICTATFIISILMVGFVFVRIPANYFSDEDTSVLVSDRHPALRLAWRIGKNLLGLILVIGGLVMLVTPGQGLLTVLVGILLLEFPGKRRLECKLVSQPAVLHAINKLRARYGKAPLILGNGKPCELLTPIERAEEDSKHVFPRH